MHITQTPYVKKTITAILKSSPIKRGFFSITHVLPTKSKKPYNYVTPQHITASGYTVLDNFYQTTELLRYQTHLTEDDIAQELDDHNHLYALTKELKKNNPDFLVNFLGVYMRAENDVTLHNDSEIKTDNHTDLGMILPIHRHDKQTLFFDNNHLFEEIPNNKNFYRIKKDKKNNFLNDLSNAQKNIPNNAIASLFYIDDKEGNPVIHCGPFDATNTLITDSVANAMRLKIDESDRKRCFIAWTMGHKS